MQAAEFIARISVEGMQEFLSDIGRADAVFAAFVGDSVEEAVKIERLTAAFGGLSHSMQMGGAIMNEIRGYARTSINIFDDLANAGERLEAAGLNVGRWLPLIDVMSAIRGGGAAQLNQFADAFARIASGGNFGMAMRVLRGVGIGLNDLKAEGIKIGGNNQIQEKDPAKVLEALERIFQRKFGEMGEYLHKTMSVKFANLQDAWNHLIFRFGEQWFPLIGKIVQSVTDFVNFIAFSGEVDKIGKAFASVFEGLFQAGGGQKGIEHFLSYLIATLEFIPSIIKTIGETIFKVLEGIANGFIRIMNSITQTAVLAINSIMLQMAPTIDVFRGLFAMVVQGMRLMHQRGTEGINLQELQTPFRPTPLTFTPIKDVNDLAGSLLSKLTNMPFVKDVKRRGDEIFADFGKFKFDPIKNPEGNGIFNANHLAQIDKLEDIKQNTAKVAAHMDKFTRFALGGGERGQVGVTTSEFFGRGRNAGNVRIDGGRLHDSLSRAIVELVQETAQGMRRADLGGY